MEEECKDFCHNRENTCGVCPYYAPPAASAGSTAESINGGISTILHNVLRGEDADVWRTPDGHIRWGKVEAAMHEIVNQYLR